MVKFWCFTWKITHSLWMTLATRFTFIIERSWKNMYFHQNWLDHLLLMMSYLVTIATDHHYTCLKMCTRDEWTATENVRYWCFILNEKTQKNLIGGASTPPPPLYVRGLIYWTWAIHRHMKLKSAPENCSKIWEERSMTTNTIPCFVATFCKHVQGARRPNFIGYTHNQGSKQYT